MKRLLVPRLISNILVLILVGCTSVANSQIIETPGVPGELFSLPLIPAEYSFNSGNPTATSPPTQTNTPSLSETPTQEPTLTPTIDPTMDTIDLIPVDRGYGTYKGLPLWLVDNGAPTITPVDGIIGVVCVGMSNAHIECRDYIEKWLAGNFAGEVNPQVKFINCARASRAIEHWNDPQYDAELWDDCINDVIPDLGYRPEQIRVIWHKAAKMNVFQNGPPPLYPDPESDYYNFYEDLTTFAGRVPEKFPSVQAVYVTSRSYGGFSVLPERGEPRSYEEGHALNTWLTDYPMVEGVWYGWGPYFWAPDCATGITNGSGVCYVESDFHDDGIHPIEGALEKMTPMLHNRMRMFDWYDN
jgi:hypothetical protein